MITIFKKNDLTNVLLLLPYCIVIRIYSFLHPHSYEVVESDSYISSVLFNSIIPNPYVQAVLAVLLIYMQALLINLLVNRHRIYQRPSSLAGMSYILLVSCFKELQVLTPALVGMSFIILAAFSVFNTYKQSKAVMGISNSAIAASIGTLIYPPFATVIVVLLVGLGMLRSFRNKERLQFLLSWLVGFWIIGSLLFVLDVLQWDFWNEWGLFQSLREINFSTNLSTIILGMVVSLLVISFVNYYNYKKKKGIEIRKKIDFFYWMTLICFISFLFYQNIGIQHLIFFCLPISVFLSLSWASFKHSSWAELTHFIIVGLVFYNLFLMPI